MASDNEQAPPNGPTVDELNARDGWMVEGPQARHDRNPDTFWLPGDSIRAAIGPGSQIRLLFWFIDEDATDHVAPQCERIWALVEARDADIIRGRLTAPPLSVHATLEMGELINFRSTDAIDVIDAEDDWREHCSFLRAVFEGDSAFEEWKRAHPHKLDPPA